MGEGVEDVGKERSKEEVVEVMDTPERSKSTQIAASISKFEDSPVFNFLNSLSPIKPVKSIHITQTINPLSFASLPSVFTSPHATSLKESRFLRRHQLSDPSKPEFSSDEGTAAHDTNKGNTVCSTQLGEHQENVNPRESDSDLATEQSYDCSKFVVDFPEDSDCNSPEPTLRTSCSSKGKELADYASNSSALVPIVQNGSHIDHNKEGTSCDWENLICEASDLLIFESPDVPNMHTLCVVGPPEGCDQENLSTQPGEGNEMIDNAQAHDNPGEKSDYENLPGFYRGMRRRCLVFEMGGARRKHLDENSGSDDTSLLMQSDGSGSSTNDQKLVPTIKAGNESSRCVLPGIGLHLNALAATPKDYKIVTHDSSAPGRLLIGPSSSVNFHSSNTNQEMLNSILPEREIDSVEDAIMPMEDASQASGFMANEDINQSSPKKKRRKADQTEEAGSCKRCNCKKSKCLKLYCECFAAGVYCVEPCACIDCFNKPVHEDTVLATRKQIESRNPLAFAPKVIRGADPIAEIGDDSSKTPASARHKRGCNCKKSGCLKKYCECYQGGVGCSINCRCEGCKNAYGRKDGTEAEIEEDETETNEKSTVEQNMDSAPPATPIRPTRQSGQLPFSSKRKPPRSSFPSIGSSSSSFYTNQGGFAKPSFFQPPPPPKFDQHFETIREDEEMPEFLQGESSPIGGIKMSSPNRKRVSPPHNVGMPPGLRSSRKLILQSIPSFPSLTSNQ